ncbi:MAG: hypothetical protein WC721_22255 [Victivallaceae bacterium]|jgi:hypothetical protein
MATLKALYRDEERRATPADIRAIVGPLDDVIIDAILHTDATPSEVLQALEWLEENYYTRASFARRMDERVRNVYNILDYERNFLGGNNIRH